MTNQRASRVSVFVVVALAVLAVGAPVPKALAAQHETRCCVLADHTHQLACAQYTSDHCSAATTTTGPSTTTTTSTSTSTTSTSTSTSTTSTFQTTSTSTPTTSTSTSTSTSTTSTSTWFGTW